MDNIEFKKDMKDYELHYWVVKGKDIDRSTVMSNMFNIDPLQIEVAADVGCGPLGGIFNSWYFHTMYAIDPMFKEYHEADILNIPNDVKLIFSDASGFTLPIKADVIFSFNALDHSGDLKKSFANIMSNLADEGKFCFHIHLRTKDQLNIGHRMAISEGDIDKILDPYTILDKKILEECPLDKKMYRSYIAMVTK